jgi:hypothetical protein
MDPENVVDLRDIIQPWIECSEKHRTSVSIGHFAAEDVIATFFIDHCHLTTSPAGMREDFQKLSTLLSRLCTKELMEIIEITERRNLKIEFEIKYGDH